MLDPLQRDEIVELIRAEMAKEKADEGASVSPDDVPYRGRLPGTEDDD